MSAHAVLDPAVHASLRIRTDRGFELGDAVMSCVTVPDEFRRVQADYPILFQLDANGEHFHAVALFGFEDGENLFLSGDRWDARYRPMAIDIQPFLIGRAADEDGRAQVHLDAASPRIARGTEEGVRVFDADGRATPYLDQIAERLGDLDQGYRAGGDFFAALRRHALLEPLRLEVTLDDGSVNSLVGFHAIDEGRLATLDGETVAALHAAGHLMPIFMAIASIGRFADLIARKNRRLRGG